MRLSHVSGKDASLPSPGRRYQEAGSRGRAKAATQAFLFKGILIFSPRPMIPFCDEATSIPTWAPNALSLVYENHSGKLL